MQEIVGHRLPKFNESEVKMVKGSEDFVSINEYTFYYMYDNHQPKPKVPSYHQDWHVGFAFENNGKLIGEKANFYWLYDVPWGIYKALMYVKEHYGNATIILPKNGMDYAGNLTLAEELLDSKRIKYYKDYLTQLKKGVDDGANVVCYFAWSSLDNFEWKLGYTSRFSIVYYDYNSLKEISQDVYILVQAATH